MARVFPLLKKDTQTQRFHQESHAWIHPLLGVFNPWNSLCLGCFSLWNVWKTQTQRILKGEGGKNKSLCWISLGIFFDFYFFQRQTANFATPPAWCKCQNSEIYQNLLPHWPSVPSGLRCDMPEERWYPNTDTYNCSLPLVAFQTQTQNRRVLATQFPKSQPCPRW